MFTELGREVVSSVNNDSSVRALKYWIRFMSALDSELVESGQICCESITPKKVCMKCFGYHLDRNLKNKLIKLMWDKYKEKVD